MSDTCPLYGSGPQAVRVEIHHSDGDSERRYVQMLAELAQNPYEPVLIYDEGSESPISLGVIREDIAEIVEENRLSDFIVNSSYLEIAHCFIRFRKSGVELVASPLDYTGWLAHKSFQRLARRGQSVSSPCVDVVVGYEAIEVWLTHMDKCVPGAKLSNLCRAVELLTDAPEGAAVPA